MTDLDQLTSRFALADLVSDYALGVDKHELDRFRNIWWDDAVWDIEFVKAFSGLDEIVGAVEDLIWPMWESTNHYCANHRVTFDGADRAKRSEEHTSELQSLMRISYAVFCLKKKKNRKKTDNINKKH